MRSGSGRHMRAGYTGLPAAPLKVSTSGSTLLWFSGLVVLFWQKCTLLFWLWELVIYGFRQCYLFTPYAAFPVFGQVHMVNYVIQRSSFQVHRREDKVSPKARSHLYAFMIRKRFPNITPSQHITRKQAGAFQESISNSKMVINQYRLCQPPSTTRLGTFSQPT